MPTARHHSYLPANLRPDDPGPPARADDRSQPGKVTGRLRVAVDAMVWDSLKRADAAAKAGMTDHSLRTALHRPHVKAHYLRQLDVLRTSEKARSIHALCDVRDASENAIARVQAAKILLADDDQVAHRGTAQQLPGFIIQIVAAPSAETASSTVPTITTTYKEDAAASHNLPHNAALDADTE